MLKSIANQVACRGANSANTGKLGCLSLFGSVEHFLCIPRGHKYSGTTVFNIDFITTEIEENRMIPLIGASTFEDVSGEDSYSSNSSTVKRLNIPGLPEYRLTFEEGHEFYRELSKLESFKTYDIILGDENGNWMVTTSSDDSFGGFSTGHLTPELTSRKVKGGDSEMKSILSQFIDRLQWDKNYAILHSDAEDIDFIPSEIPSINGINLSFDAIPVAAETSLKVAVKLAADNTTYVEGLELLDIEVLVNGSSVVIADVTEANNIYDVEIPAVATGDKIVVRAEGIVNLTGTLYRTNSEASVEAIT